MFYKEYNLNYEVIFREVLWLDCTKCKQTTAGKMH